MPKLILRRAGCTYERGIHDRATLEFHAARLKHPTDFRKQLLAQFVDFEKTTEFEQRGGVWYHLAVQINSHKATQASAIVKRLFTG